MALRRDLSANRNVRFLEFCAKESDTTTWCDIIQQKQKNGRKSEEGETQFDIYIEEKGANKESRIYVQQSTQIVDHAPHRCDSPALLWQKNIPYTSIVYRETRTEEVEEERQELKEGWRNKRDCASSLSDHNFITQCSR